MATPLSHPLLLCLPCFPVSVHCLLQLVRISKTPGCTASVNYFSLGCGDAQRPADAYLVDLPGFG